MPDQKEMLSYYFEPRFQDWWDLVHGKPTPDPDLFNSLSGVYKVNALIELLKAGAWGGKGPTLDQLADAVRGVLDGSDKDSKFAQWTPESPELPWPSVAYKLEEAAKAVVAKTSEDLKADEAKLNPNQLALVGVRSDMKSGVLLSMKAAELAAEAQASADAMKAEIQKICLLLWGKLLDTSGPPDDVPEDKQLDWWTKTIETMTATTTSDPVEIPETAGLGKQVIVPLAGQLNDLVAKYNDKQSKMEENSTQKEEQPVLVAMLDQIENLRTEIQILEADVFGLLATLIEITKGEGGVLDFTSLGMEWLTKLQGLQGIEIDGVEIDTPPTQEEKDAAQAAADKFANFGKWAKNILGWAYGVNSALKKFADGIGLEFSLGTQDRITEIKATIEAEFPKEEQGSNWWLLLLAAAAVASQQKK